MRTVNDQVPYSLPPLDREMLLTFNKREFAWKALKLPLELVSVARSVAGSLGSLSAVDLVLALGDALPEGARATLLADRARAHEATVVVDFMGAPAAFPVAPFLIASILKVPAVLCLGMYRGGKRYDLYFEAFADELALPRRAREAELRAVVQRYASRLEHYVRQDPYNWFNWHDFWNLEGFDDADLAAGERDLADPVSRSA
jgi:predicted LPLAT superfamily acyltransferase